MENKGLTRLDIASFAYLNSKIIDSIYKYIEHKYQNIKDFWLEDWYTLGFGERIHIEFGTDDGSIEDTVNVDEFLKICNN